MKTKSFFLFILIFIFSSCKYGAYIFDFYDDDVNSRSPKLIKLENIPSVESNEIYSFIIVTDMHLDNFSTKKDKDFFHYFENQLKNADESLRPKFIVNLGDTTHTGSSKEMETFNEWSNKIKELAKNYLGEDDYKIYSILGNHDLYNEGWNKWKNKIYPYTSCYYFSTNKFSYYFIDTANGSVGDKQLDDLEIKLKADPNPKIIFSHYPIYAGGNLLFIIQNTLERAKLLTFFKKNNTKQIFTGHAHRTFGYDYGSFREDVTSSYKENNSFRIVTVNEKKQTVASSIYTF